MTGLFAIWNVADDTPVFFVNERGDTDIAGDLTFGFGEFIDNLVDGWLRITGNLNVTGNVTAENVFLPSHIFTHTDVSLPVISAGVWVNVTFGDTEELKKRITHDPESLSNDTFTIIDKGTYFVSYVTDFIDSAPNPLSDTAVRILRNDIEINGSTFESDANRQNDEYEISNIIHAEFEAGDTMKIQFTSDETTVSMSSHNTFGVHPDTAVLTVRRFA